MIYVESGRGLTLADTLRRNNGQKIQVNANSNPEVNDWDEDGRKDLIIGEETYQNPNRGNIRVYLNIGTNSAPVFNNYSILRAGGSPIYHYRINPRIYDLDDDGLKDLIVGENAGRLYFYKNVGTNPNPIFNASYDTLRTESGLIIDAYAGSRFGFTDWNGDGDTDFLVSGFDGYIEYYENTTIIGIEETESAALIEKITVTPNPVNSRAVLKYSLTQPAHVRADIYSVDGRLVTTPINQIEKGGYRQFIWDLTDHTGSRLPSGVYFVKISADSNTKTTRIIVIR
jgi:hypothetical protein